MSLQNKQLEDSDLQLIDDCPSYEQDSDMIGSYPHASLDTESVVDPDAHRENPSLPLRHSQTHFIELNNFSREQYEEIQSELVKERALRKLAEAELAEQKLVEKDIRTKWKQAARDLNKMQTQGPGFPQITDDYLVGLITGLRYNIRTFSIQYFTGPVGHAEIDQGSTGDKESYYSRFIKSTLNYRRFLDCSELRPCVIQRVLWKAIVEDLFRQFRWAGDASTPIWSICKLLEPTTINEDLKSSLNTEMLKKFQIWGAVTTGLLLNAIEGGVDMKVGARQREWGEEFFKDIQTAFRPFQTVRNDGYDLALSGIINQALELDKEVCRQLARIEWDFEGDNESMPFDSTLMELGNGQKPAGSEPIVSLVICPAVKKRGKSTGEGFDEESVLLRMEVSCDIPDTSQ